MNRGHKSGLPNIKMGAAVDGKRHKRIRSSEVMTRTRMDRVGGDAQKEKKKKSKKINSDRQRK